MRYPCGLFVVVLVLGVLTSSALGNNGFTHDIFGDMPPPVRPAEPDDEPVVDEPIYTGYRPGHWTFPGESIAAHLMSSQHAGQLARLGVDVNTATEQELLNLHDALHEGRAIYTATESTGCDIFGEPLAIADEVVVGSSDCPGGVCPTGTCPTGTCPTGTCPTGTCPTGTCPQMVATRETYYSPTVYTTYTCPASVSYTTYTRTRSGWYPGKLIRGARAARLQRIQSRRVGPLRRLFGCR